jgi:NADPH-dependent 2,4-dienoyl-CoA reductase/sulfur reductase-like enzyme
VPRAEIVLVEREPFFALATAQLRYLFGLTGLQDIARSYRAISRPGLRVVNNAVIALDRDRRRVVTSEGGIDYDYLVLAAGARLAEEEVPGLTDRPGLNLCPYARASELVDVCQRIERFQGGHVVIGTPNGPYKCPPAPYEYALLWATHIERRALKARVTFVDPRSRPTPSSVAPGLMEAMEAHGRVLTYEPVARVHAVDAEARTVDTEAGRLAFDVLSVIPPHTGLPFIRDSGLGNPFVEVDLRTFRALRDDRIYAVGDNADTPFAKTGYTAMDAGRIAGVWIARELGVQMPEPGLPGNICYPLVARDRALRIETRWALERDTSGSTHVKMSGTTDHRAKAAYARLRRDWEARALSTLFGP